MYCNFFKFSERPFDLTPDPKFLYLNKGYRETLASLLYGIRERRGFITVVSEVGMGKTTLLNAVLDCLDENTKVAYISNTDVTFLQMLNMSLIELGISRPGQTLCKIEAIHRLNEFSIEQLAKGGNVALIVDEAQNLDALALENIRLLSNLETHKRKLVQIILSGQSELDTKLNAPELRQLAQRVSLRRYLAPLSEKETYSYIGKRLGIANYKGPSLFSKRSRQLIWEYAGGIPRKINILCDNALLIGYGLKKKKIQAEVVEEAIKDLSWSPYLVTIEPRPTAYLKLDTSKFKKWFFYPRFSLAAVLLLTTCLSFTMGLFLGKSLLSPHGSNSLAVQNPAQAELQSLSDIPEQSLTHALIDNFARATQQRKVTLRTVPEEIVRPKSIPEGEQVLVAQNSAEVPSETKKEQPEVTPESGSKEKEKVLNRNPTTIVIAKRGDTLFRIIMRSYGKYSKTMLSTVLSKNPEIVGPTRIFPGQAIKLPEIN